MLLVGGTPTGVLTRVVLLEAAVPLVAATIVAAGVAYGTSVMAFLRLAPSGTAIPQLARLMAVVDTFDAMTTNRPYREGMHMARALMLIERGAGSQFDPGCVEAFLRLRPVLEQQLSQKRLTAKTVHDGLSDCLHQRFLTAATNGTKPLFEARFTHLAGKAGVLARTG